MKFKLTIELGNDAMQTGRDVAKALIYIGERMNTRYGDLPMDRKDEGSIWDLNGNKVGVWKVTGK